MEKKRVLVCGTDERQIYLADSLSRIGYEVLDETAVDESSAFLGILLPVTETAAYYTRLKGYMKLGMFVFGSNFKEEAKEEEKRMQLTLVDYMKEPGVADKNAVATAEGVLAEAITGMKQNLSGSNCLVAGYGRCGSVIAEKLLALNAKVSVWEKEEERLTCAEKNGCKRNVTDDFSSYDLMVNTVPALIFDAKVLKTVREDALILDIATKPGGVDFSYCEKNNKNAKHCPGLPARYAPKTSAEILAEVVRKYI